MPVKQIHIFMIFCLLVLWPQGSLMNCDCGQASLFAKYIYIYLYMFYFLNISLTYTKCKLVCYPLHVLFSWLDVLMQSGTEVTWHLMFSILPPVSCNFCTTLYDVRGMWWRNWLRDCATSQKVAGLIPDGVVGIFHFALWPWGWLSL